MRRSLSLSLALLAAASLAACSGGSDAPPPPEDPVENVEEVVDETPSENFAEPEPIPTPTAAPAPIVEQDRPTEEQVMDDADAVGMTKRLPRQDETAPVE